MSVLSQKLYSPEIRTDHPVTITAVLNAGDLRRTEIAVTPAPDEVRNMDPGSLRGDVTRTGVSTGESPLAYDIAWPAIRRAVTYRLYGSMSPFGHGTLLQQDIELPETIWHVPYLSETVAYFFWASFVDANGTEIFITDEPASLMTSIAAQAWGPDTITPDRHLPGAQGLDSMMKEALEFIRASNRLQLELGAEQGYLYLRRYAEDRPWGRACSCTDQRNRRDSDPDHVGKARCKLCFGTGIFGGFLPKIPMLIRYGAAPKELWKWTKRGQELQSTFNTYALPFPVIRVGDLVVRSNGKRYLVTETQPDISARGVRLHQEFNLQMVENSSILAEVTDAAIERGIQIADAPKFMRDGYRIFG